MSPCFISSRLVSQPPSLLYPMADICSKARCILGSVFKKLKNHETLITHNIGNYLKQNYVIQIILKKVKVRN